MKTKEIEIISEIVNYKRFADAADSMSYSHSVISKYVTSVESELGIKLFVRGNKASELALTPEGKILIPAIQRVNDDYRHVLELVSQMKNDRENTVRIGLPMSLVDIAEQEILSAFMCANPNVKVEQMKMLPVELLKMLKARRIDAAFIVVPDGVDLMNTISGYCDDDDMDVKFIIRASQRYAAVSEEFFKSASDAATFSELRDFTFIFPIGSDGEERSLLEIARENAARSGFELKTMSSNVYDSTLFRLALKMPAAILSVAPDDHYKGIRFVRISDWDTGFNVYFLSPKNDKRRSLQQLRHCCARFADEVKTAGSGDDTNI